MNALPNQSPVAVASANTISGEVPLLVGFTGGESSDDKAIVDYKWDFKDGSTASSANSSHTFDTPGTYNVELTVEDEQGLLNKDTVTITVNAQPNQPPVAVASANTISGEAPLQVSFTGSESSDDKGIVGYIWNFPNGSSSSANTTQTFNNPGIYNITLTVTDAEGLQHLDELTITVDEPEIIQPPSAGCTTNGGQAGDTGLKTWCWGDVSVPSYTGGGASFSNGQLAIGSECSPNQVQREGDRLRFYLDPLAPFTSSCNNDFNMRAEIRTSPWRINHPKGTEEWFGWSYTFGDSYVIDQNNPWLFFQVHHAVNGDSPHFELMVAKDGSYGAEAGEIVVKNLAASDQVRTRITPKAGETLDIVVHAIWGDESNGLIEVWIDGNKVYDKQIRTVYSHHEYGGNAKWGIYKWPWRNESAVQTSVEQGATEIETYMGSLRMITRKPGDSDYRKNSYSEVVPR